MIAQLISTGTELVMGQTIDTNSAWLAQRLAEMGIVCARHVTVGDERGDIANAIREAVAQANIVLVSGGLGPTADDLTREALADAMGVELQFHSELHDHIAGFFRTRNRTMHEGNRQQAFLPVGATALENINGTAPGIRATVGEATVYVMPGVPREMFTMFDRCVRPDLESLAGGRVILQGMVRTFGMSESELGGRLADMMTRGRNPTVGTSAADLVISVRVNAYGTDRACAQGLLETDVAAIKQRIGSPVFGVGEETLSSAVAGLLIGQKRTVSTAESCTGGLIAKHLTDISGSSAYFLQGFVTYSNEAKVGLLQIDLGLLQRHGAVSVEVAEAMAVNCRRISGTDFALSATGIAGPTGGTATKPVGLVCLGLATPQRVVAKEYRFGDTIDRDQIRDRATKTAINLLRLELLGESR